MSETVRKQDEQNDMPKRLNKRAVSSITKHINVRRTQFLKNDSEFLVKSGKCVQFIDIETATKIHYNNMN